MCVYVCIIYSLGNRIRCHNVSMSHMFGDKEIIVILYMYIPIYYLYSYVYIIYIIHAYIAMHIAYNAYIFMHKTVVY